MYIRIPASLLLSVVCLQWGCSTFSRMLAKSGTEFKIEIQTNEDDKNAIVERAIKVTQNKLNAVGLVGEVNKDAENSNRFIVRVYGTEDLDRLKKFLFTAYQLELRKVVSPPSPAPAKTYPTAEAARLNATGDQEVLSSREFEGLADLKLEALKPQFFIVEKAVIVSGEDIRDAQAVSRSGSDSDYQISFSLKSEGAAKFGEWTGKNIGNYLAIVLDKKVESTPYIRGQIFDQGEISGRFTKESANDIALSLKSGYLPATMKIMEEKQFEK